MTLTEDKIREAIAESGKTKTSEMMSYLERFHKGNYNKVVAKKNATELANEMKSYL